MYQTHKVCIKEDMVFSELVIDNPLLLMVMEFFNIDDAISDDTVGHICEKNGIELPMFLIFANLYNGFNPDRRDITTSNIDVKMVIKFLRRAHLFYIHEKYPEVQNYIKQLYAKHNRYETESLELFFDNYFNEVLEHLKYEDEVAFPYFLNLSKAAAEIEDASFSVNEYSNHHTDIETKLSDLKNLLVKHVSIKDNFPLKRKIITSLFELENDLAIHSMIEEYILSPLVEQLEKNKNLE